MRPSLSHISQTPHDLRPERAADQLLLLIDGVLVGAVTRPETHPAKTVREMAERVLDATPNGRCSRCRGGVASASTRVSSVSSG